ncbi:MAG: hypothetical protein WDN03_14660 [Rhizomicrobium sp.]
MAAAGFGKAQAFGRRAPVRPAPQGSRAPAATAPVVAAMPAEAPVPAASSTCRC